MSLQDTFDKMSTDALRNHDSTTRNLLTTIRSKLKNAKYEPGNSLKVVDDALEQDILRKYLKELEKVCDGNPQAEMMYRSEIDLLKPYLKVSYLSKSEILDLANSLGLSSETKLGIFMKTILKDSEPGKQGRLDAEDVRSVATEMGIK